jgi:hypothetical protein
MVIARLPYTDTAPASALTQPIGVSDAFWVNNVVLRLHRAADCISAGFVPGFSDVR